MFVVTQLSNPGLTSASCVTNALMDNINSISYPMEHILLELSIRAHAAHLSLSLSFPCINTQASSVPGIAQRKCYNERNNRDTIMHDLMRRLRLDAEG